MRAQSRSRRQATRAIVGLALAGAVWFWWNFLPPAPDPWLLNLANNPDKFFLWASSTNIHHSFTYDPHAADEWRFEHGVLPDLPQPATDRGK